MIVHCWYSGLAGCLVPGPGPANSGSARIPVIASSLKWLKPAVSVELLQSDSGKCKTAHGWRSRQSAMTYSRPWAAACSLSPSRCRYCCSSCRSCPFYRRYHLCRHIHFPIWFWRPRLVRFGCSRRRHLCPCSSERLRQSRNRWFGNHHAPLFRWSDCRPQPFRPTRRQCSPAPPQHGCPCRDCRPVSPTRCPLVRRHKRRVSMFQY